LNTHSFPRIEVALIMQFVCEFRNDCPVGVRCFETVLETDKKITLLCCC
jgi:hypothetical protein